ncbi:hypothetical protein CKAH01_10808 [Colletotrichum kahawae]|uniref:Uncharacterized protein n=1 Tax=Colletotrichum kahawae TaxID=34407 RepID=A0AAE0CX50_COLKA|nr:hypothetical protein CKAH01_10808 [Colletotrichum kahawae]
MPSPSRPKRRRPLSTEKPHRPCLRRLQIEGPALMNGTLRRCRRAAFKSVKAPSMPPPALAMAMLTGIMPQASMRSTPRRVTARLLLNKLPSTPLNVQHHGLHIRICHTEYESTRKELNWRHRFGNAISGLPVFLGLPV